VARNILGVIFAIAFVASFILMFVCSPSPDIQITVTQSFGIALWKFRALDVFLQLLIILAGTFSILTLVKERSK